MLPTCPLPPVPAFLCRRAAQRLQPAAWLPPPATRSYRACRPTVVLPDTTPCRRCPIPLRIYCIQLFKFGCCSWTEQHWCGPPALRVVCRFVQPPPYLPLPSGRTYSYRLRRLTLPAFLLWRRLPSLACPILPITANPAHVHYLIMMNVGCSDGYGEPWMTTPNTNRWAILDPVQTGRSFYATGWWWWSLNREQCRGRAVCWLCRSTPPI